MFDAQCDLAALVYRSGQDPDALLREFAADLVKRGRRPVGLVQLGRKCEDTTQLSAVLLHSGEMVSLFQDLGSCAQGCRLDVARLTDAGERVAGAIEQGADIVLVNRYGKQERDGKGLLYLIERALDADIPVVIAVHEAKFPHWLEFSGGMSVRIPCDRDALEKWWRTVSRRNVAPVLRVHHGLRDARE